MAEPQFLEQGAGPNEQRWLFNTVEELERQLRFRTILLAGAVTLSAFLGSIVIVSFYKSELSTVALALDPPSIRPGGSPSATWKAERPSIDRSRAWAAAEERIEAIALHFDAQRTETPIKQSTTTGPDTERSEAVHPAEARSEKILGASSEPLVRDCSPVSPEAVLNASLNQNGNMAARAIERLQYAATDFVNLRVAPNNHADVITVVAQGDLVRRTGREVGWLQVEYGDGSASSIKGWVYSNHLRRVDASGEPDQPSAFEVAGSSS
jgi:hypothetical protein